MKRTCDEIELFQRDIVVGKRVRKIIFMNEHECMFDFINVSRWMSYYDTNFTCDIIMI